MEGNIYRTRQVTRQHIRRISFLDLPYAACDHPGCSNGANWKILGFPEQSVCDKHMQDFGWYVNSDDTIEPIIDSQGGFLLTDIDSSRSVF